MLQPSSGEEMAGRMAEHNTEGGEAVAQRCIVLQHRHRSFWCFWDTSTTVPSAAGSIDVPWW